MRVHEIGPAAELHTPTTRGSNAALPRSAGPHATPPRVPVTLAIAVAIASACGVGDSADGALAGGDVARMGGSTTGDPQNVVTAADEAHALYPDDARCWTAVQRPLPALAAPHTWASRVADDRPSPTSDSPRSGWAEADTRQPIRENPRLYALALGLARHAADSEDPREVLDVAYVHADAMGLAGASPRISLRARSPSCTSAEACDDLDTALRAEVERAARDGGTKAKPWIEVARVDGPRHSVGVLVTTPRRVEVDPIEARARVGASRTLAATFAADLGAPRLVLSDPSVLSAGAPRIADRRFTTKLTCTHEGVSRVELLADGPRGPEVLSDIPLACGAAPVPAEPSWRETATGCSDDDAASAAARWIEARVDAHRRAQGLVSLRWSDALAAVARAHAQGMAADGHIAHIRAGKDVGDRLRDAGIDARAWSENIAVGGGPRQVDAALQRSTAHRRARLDTGIEEVGIGAVLVREGDTVALYVTEVFARP